MAQQRDTTIKWEHIADNIGQFRALLGRNIDPLHFEDRQAVVQLLVEKVVVHPDGAVAVHHVLPFEDPPVAADQKKKASRVHVMSCDRNTSSVQRLRQRSATPAADTWRGPFVRMWIIVAPSRGASCNLRRRRRKIGLVPCPSTPHTRCWAT